MGGCLSSRSSRRSSLPPEAPAMYSTSTSAASRSLKSRKKQKRGGGGTGFFDRRSTAAGGGGEFVEDELHRVPGRMFLNGASGVACMFTQQGRKGTNQDAMVVWEGQDLIIGNVGDSRAILGTRDKDNNLVAVQLTVDLKPNLPREAARIHQCKGRVFALQDEPEVARVWLPNNDSPGLAMARAFGDFCLKDYGLISVPDISYRLLMEKDEFVVLATDGIWDVLSNKEVVDIVSSAPTRATASRALVDCAVRAWRMKFPTSKIDDCAAVCLFFDHPPPDQVPESYSTKPPEEPAETLVIGATAPEAENTNPDQLPTGATAPEAENTNPDQLVDGVARTYGSGLNRSSTFHDADEIVSVSDDPKIEKVTGRSQSTRSLADCISATEEEEWSALEGVTRVNSLLNLPRFLSGNKRSASWKKR